MATVWGLDWPPVGAPPSTQQQRLLDEFDRLKALGINTIIFQVVAHGEAMYASDRLPWSRWLTGIQGRDPGWDPLAYAVDAAHDRGLELHAWYNVSHVGIESSPPTTSDHVTRVHPDWIRRAEGVYWLNPGLPDARAWVVENIRELVERYDVDAVHFDYMRYPNYGFADDGSLRQLHPNDGTTLDDWRRENLNILARDLYAAVMEIRPWVKVGAAPIGAYKYFSGAPPGFWAYNDVYQASRQWVADGVHDYLAPQLYFDIGNSPDPGRPHNSQDFAFWLRDWLAGDHGRHLYVGHGTWREVYAPERAFDGGEIMRQLDLARAEGAEGQVHFRSSFVNAAVLGGRYDTAALPAAMPWKPGAAAPSAPPLTSVELESEASAITVRWQPSDPAPTDPIRRYAVFRREGGVPNTASGADLFRWLGVQDTSFTEVFTADPEVPVYYQIVAQSQLGLLSEPGAPVNTATTGLSAEDAELVGAPSIISLFPNPATTSVELVYQVRSHGPVSIRLYDPLGRVVARISHPAVHTGMHRETIHTGSIAPGVYVISLNSGTAREARTLVVTR